MAGAPDIAGEIVGYRAWFAVRSYVTGLVELTSISDETIWPADDWLRAECGYQDEPCDPPPGRGCSCGIYAARHRRHLVKMGYTTLLEHPVVMGEVGLAGRIIPGSKGWRAERARPLSLFVPFGDWKLVRPLAERYRIPVGLTDTTRGATRGHRP